MSHEAERILVLVRGGRDGELTSKLLGRDGLTAHLCEDVEALCAEIERGAGAALIAEEAITKAAVQRVRAVLGRQPVWSDLPVVVFSSAGEPRTRLLIDTVHQLGNVTFLDRPVQVRSMLAAVHAAVRSRRRQYEAQRALESRDSFLAMLGHELRNPLGAIRLASTVLNRKDRRGDPSKELAIVERQSLHLSRIVDELLDVARITHGKVALHTERLSLADVVRSAYELMACAGRDHLSLFDLVVEDEELYVEGDRQRLEQVLTNLFTNAVKYTPRGGAVTTSVSQEGERAVVVVKDDGIGLAPEMRERVFEPFAQAERSLDRSQGGLGLGLSLVRGIVELHGGSIHAESEGLGKGSAFVLSLPLLPVGTSGVVESEAAAGPSVSAKRVVVVEDNADMRELLACLLEQSGHEVTCAEAGPEGVEKILSTLPDVAFVDIGLPEMDGLEVARRVRAANFGARLVAMTGYGQVEDKAQALAAGFDYHLTKPVEDEDLARAMAPTGTK
ncbi:MAG TPA: hybrid sensor histidine kinase/response regulator [Polyangiaceae bacterium]|nr:hybrid sensor histidine kinase/response regulator [Polyangiaceae bacterium]